MVAAVHEGVGVQRRLISSRHQLSSYRLEQSSYGALQAGEGEEMRFTISDSIHLRVRVKAP